MKPIVVRPEVLKKLRRIHRIEIRKKQRGKDMTYTEANHASSDRRYYRH
jgi:hypothetical protein